MNAFNMARTAYASTGTPIRTPRGTEYDAFARITHRLKATALNAKRDYPAFVEALNENRRLWTILAEGVADRDNELPQQLRAQIFYLAEFTLQQTSKILARKAQVNALLEINTAIMRGLHQEGASA